MVICFKSRLCKRKLVKARIIIKFFFIGESRGEWNLILLLRFITNVVELCTKF